MTIPPYKKLSRLLRRIGALSRDPDLRTFSPVVCQTLRIAWTDLQRSIKQDKRASGYRKDHDTIPILKRKLDDVFSKFIRYTHQIECYGLEGDYCQCITCKNAFLLKNITNGHYIKRQYTAVRYNENNCRPQCEKCNGQDQGNDVRFRAALVAEIGETKVLALEANRKHYKHSRSELKLLLKLYMNKVKELEK